MRTPRPPGTALDNMRFREWLGPYSGYVVPVTRQKLELWIDQFDLVDRDMAARVLDAVLFLGHEHIRTTFRELLGAIPGWNMDETARTGRWFFVPFSGSVGESGDSMVHTFRMATGMTQRRFNSLFVHRSELVSRRPGPDDTVVLIDDFSGSGRQATRAWKEVFAEILTEGSRVILLLAAATRDALNNISSQTDMEPTCGTFLEKQHNLFDAACAHFSQEEKQVIERYCRRADRRNPRGSGNCGLLLVLAHRCPNNSLPILHSDHTRWSGLFPRELA